MALILKMEKQVQAEFMCLLKIKKKMLLNLLPKKSSKKFAKNKNKHTKIPYEICSSL